MPLDVRRLGYLAISFALVTASVAFADDGAGDADSITGRINAVRNVAGRAPLMRDPRLDSVAQRHAEAMATRGALFHVGEDGATPAERTRAAGVIAALVAQNISRATTATGAHEALIANDANRAHVLDARFTHVGVGLAANTDGVFVAQIFAALGEDVPSTPASAAESPTPLAAAPGAAAPVATPPSAASEPAPNAAVPLGFRRPAAASPASPTTGYWVQSGGRWWYYPIDPNGPNVQVLTPQAGPTAPTVGRVVIPQTCSSLGCASSTSVVVTTPWISSTASVRVAPRVYYAPPAVQFVAPQPRRWHRPTARWRIGF